MLPDVFLDRPIAHRGLHDLTQGRAENSMKAIEAAIAHGYGIEIDLQLSADDVAMVFHDYDLGRLTGEQGAVARRSQADLSALALLGDGDGIPSLPAVLAATNGRAPLLIELKDQDGAMGPNVGALEAATVTALQGYDGPVALMSFNPYSVAKLAELAPDISRGLVTSNWTAEDWPTIPTSRRKELAPIPDFERTGACFISHQRDDLGSPHVAKLHKDGHPILCWTIKSKAQETEARKIADNVTFEGYLA